MKPVPRDIIGGPAFRFLVLGRAEILKVTPNEPYIVISITDCDVPTAIIAESANRLAVLRRQFHDVDTSSLNDSVYVRDRIAISRDDAREIIKFVQRYRDDIRLIVCQCEGGISRSAGTAAALSRWLNGEDAVFFRSYVPNRLVYRTVLEAAVEAEPHAIHTHTEI